MSDFKCGYVSIIGQPNVGKSTLLNKILDKKISITSRKSQTTRNNIIGVKTLKNAQLIFLDTPGIHSQSKKTLNKYLNKSAKSVFEDSDILLFLIQRDKLTAQDKSIINEFKNSNVKTICAINKIDQIADKNSLLPLINELAMEHSFTDIVPISALKGNGVDNLVKVLESHLPFNPYFYPSDHNFNQHSNFFISELIREKITRIMGDEIPYEVYVEVEKNEVIDNRLEIDIVIYVAKSSQKSIVIGKDGEQLKKIGTATRRELQKIFNKKVMLRSWVKVKKNWNTNIERIQSLGIGNSIDV